MSLPLGGNVWLLTGQYTCYGVTMQNVWFYNNPTGAGSAVDLLAAFTQDVLNAILNIQSEDVEWDFIRATGVQGAVDFSEALVTNPGQVAATAEPQFVSWKYRLNRLDNTDRNGYKRIGGVPDTWWDAGAIDPANLTALNACATAMTSGISTGSIAYNPCIQRRQVGGAPVVPPTYRSHAGFTFAGVTTQNTRKS